MNFASRFFSRLMIKLGLSASADPTTHANSSMTSSDAASLPPTPSTTSPATAATDTSSTTGPGTATSGPTPQEILSVAAQVPSSDWQAIVLCGMAKTSDPSAFQVFRLVAGAEDEIAVCAQIAMRAVQWELEHRSFYRDVDHTGNTKH